MEELIVEVAHATKQFQMDTVLNDVSIKIEKAKIYGLVGRNGSGKSLLMKCICGFVPLTSGKIVVFGKEIGGNIDFAPKTGFLIEHPGLLSQYDAVKNLELIGSIQKGCSKDKIKNVIQLVGLNPESKKKVGKFSMGMKQRLGIALALLDEPDFIILDEPMNGLDNHGVEEMRKLFLELKKQGKTILLASHNRDDIEILCDEVYEMDGGVLQKKKY